MDTIYFCIILSMVVACISFTVTESGLFKPIRDLWWTDYQHTRGKVGQLFNCGYCFGHWVSFILVAIYHPRLFSFWWPVDFFLTAILVVWLAGVQWALFSIVIQFVERER